MAREIYPATAGRSVIAVGARVYLPFYRECGRVVRVDGWGGSVIYTVESDRRGRLALATGDVSAL